MSKKAFIEFRQAWLEAIKANAQYQAVKASGKFEAFIDSDASYEVTADDFTQYGTSYTPFMDVGRGATTSRTGGLVDAIYEWLRL
jgi:hypothetical protein